MALLSAPLGPRSGVSCDCPRRNMMRALLSVNGRWVDIGIRLALGATAGAVIAMVLVRVSLLRSRPQFPPTARHASIRPTCSDRAEHVHRSENCTLTVMLTSTGTPLRSVGVNSHCRTASMAAATSSGCTGVVASASRGWSASIT